VEYLRRAVGFDLTGGVVVARLEVDYETPLAFDDGPARVGVRVPRLGGSSFPMCYSPQNRSNARSSMSGETVSNSSRSQSASASSTDRGASGR